jgi:hypothetical protein
MGRYTHDWRELGRMRPCLQRDWKRAASSGLEKTSTGSSGWSEMKALMMEGGMVGGGLLEGVRRGVVWELGIRTLNFSLRF